MSDRLPPEAAAPVSVDLAVVSALPYEIEAVTNMLQFPGTLSTGPFPRISPPSDTADGRSIVCLVTGAGKTFAARGMGLFLARYRPVRILAVGIAGSAVRGVEVGDFVVGTGTRYYDVDATALGIAYGTATPRGAHSFELYHSERDVQNLREVVAEVSDRGATVHLGEIATGDTFVDRAVLRTLPPRWRERIETSPAVDMESAAWAETSSPYRIPTTVLRMISDHVYTGGRLPFRGACALLGEIALRWLLRCTGT